MQPISSESTEADYLARSGDDHVDDNRVSVEGHGWASFELKDGDLVIRQCYGDGRFWHRFATELADHHGCERIVFATRRPPKAWIRRFDAKVIGYVLELPRCP